MTSPREAAVALRDALVDRARAAAVAAVDAQAAAARAQVLADQAAALAVLIEQQADPQPVPDDATAVRIGVATYPLAGTNPTGTAYPGGRGPNELVLYRDPVGFTATNVFGTEVMVLAGRVVSAVDREATRQQQGVIVPSSGYVLSGHGAARAWLNTHAVKGAVVELVHLDEPEPSPVIDPAPGQPATRTIAIYRKDGSSSTARIPEQVNQFRYSFFQRNRLVEWGGEDIATQRVNLGRWLDTGGRGLLISAGGSRGSVDTSNRGVFLAGFLAAEKQLGDRVGGIDWDLEAVAMVVEDVVAISKALADGRKSRYMLSFAPPGGDPVKPAIEAAVQLHRAGYQVQLGQQLYEGREPITLDAAMGALRRAVDAGLPPSCVLLGTMVGSDPKHWTIDMCVRVLRAALDEWPNFGGCYLWSEGQEAQDAEWARRMAAELAGRGA